jgi:hypothetical protein
VVSEAILLSLCNLESFLGSWLSDGKFVELGPSQTSSHDGLLESTTGEPTWNLASLCVLVQYVGSSDGRQVFGAIYQRPKQHVNKIYVLSLEDGDHIQHHRQHPELYQQFVQTFVLEIVQDLIIDADRDDETTI